MEVAVKTCFRFLFLVIAMATAVLVQTAGATVISGTFAGTAVHVHGGPFSVQEGDLVTGVFSLDTGYPFELIGGDGSTNALFEYSGRFTSPDPLPPPPMRIAIDAPSAGILYDLAGNVADVTLAQDASGQKLTLLTGYGGYCCAASLVLFGEPGAFFSSLDMAALHGGEVDPGRSFASYSYKGSLDFDVAFTSFDFDTPAVPEPQTLALAGVAILALLMVRRRFS